MQRNSQIEYVPVDSIKPDPNQPRKTWNDDRLKAQGESYKVHGIINPIEIDENSMIITGESRWRASKLAELPDIPVIRIKGVEAKKRFYRQAAENMARTDLTPQEQLVAVKKVWQDLVDEKLPTGSKLEEGQGKNMMYSEVARRLGITPEWVGDLVDRIGTAAPEIQKLFRENKIQVSAIRTIRRLENPETEVKVAQKAATENLKRDDVVTIVDAIKEFPQKTEHILSETYPPKHDDMVRTMDKVTGKGKILVKVPLTDDEKIRNWARDLSAKLNDALELMYSLPVKNLNPHTLAMLYDQTIRLPIFILNFHDKVTKFNEKVAKALHNKTLKTVEFKELKGE